MNFDNRYILSIHEPPPMEWLNAHMTVSGQAAGWIVHTHALGHDPAHHSGFDYSQWANAGWGQIARLNNGYKPAGTIPLDPERFVDFATRCGWWVANSQGCTHWIVGNEPNCSTEGLVPIEQYASCFRLVYEAIKALQPEATVMPAPVAMWNCELWDWLWYYEQILARCWPFDALCWHTYTHGSDPGLITSMQTMDSLPDRLYHFRAYQDLWARTAKQYHHLPIFITETDQGDISGVRNPWLDEPGVHWIQEAIVEIARFRDESGADVHCLVCYRWPKYDEWYIEGKEHVHADLAAAVAQGHVWRTKEPDMSEWETIYQTSMDEGFYDYEGVAELTVPNGAVPIWEHDGSPAAHLPRPEYDKRSEPHVHTPPNAAGMFSMSSTMEAAIMFEVAGIAPGTEVRASVYAMARDAAGSGLGMRIGIATEDPDEGAIEVETPDGKFTGALDDLAVWGEWQSNTSDGIWERLWAPVVVATGSRVWVLLNGRKDWAAPAHTHWDDLIVEARGGSLPPGNGQHTVRVDVFFDDHLVSSSEAQVSCSGQVNAQVCDLARQIQVLTCPGA